jgi:hypothetical protein
MRTFTGITPATYMNGWNETMGWIDDKGLDRARELVNNAAPLHSPDYRSGLLDALTFYAQNNSTMRKK